MDLRIGISGAACSGKTSLIKALQKSSYLKQLSTEIGEIEFIPEVVRELKDKYSFKINELGTLDTDLIVFTAHIQNLLLKKRFISDRNLVDNYVYAKLEKIPLPDFYTKWNLDMVLRMASRYDILFYIPNEFPLENDGTRNIDAEYHNKSISLFDMVFTLIAEKHPKLVIKLLGSVEERVKMFEEVVQKAVESKRLLSDA